MYIVNDPDREVSHLSSSQKTWPSFHADLGWAAARLRLTLRSVAIVANPPGGICLLKA